MNKLLLFVAEEDQQTVLDAYEKRNPIRIISMMEQFMF